MVVLLHMKTFAMVVKHGSFTAAAEQMDISKALASKYVSQLETHLGVQLLNRTTRQLHLTEAGQAYVERCRSIVQDIEELEAAMTDQQQQPQGKLRVSAPMTLGELYLAEAISVFLCEQTKVSLELVLTDRYVNLVEEGFDVAIRIGELSDSSMVARQLSSSKMVVCATPYYFEKNGMPQHPSELSQHNCIIDTNVKTSNQWSFQDQGEALTVQVNGRLYANNALAVREALLAGHGLGYSPVFAVRDALQNKSLVRCLQPFEKPPMGIYAVYPGNRYLAAKVRAFIDFMVSQFKSVGAFH